MWQVMTSLFGFNGGRVVCGWESRLDGDCWPDLGFVEDPEGIGYICEAVWESGDARCGE